MLALAFGCIVTGFTLAIPVIRFTRRHGWT